MLVLFAVVFALLVPYSRQIKRQTFKNKEFFESFNNVGQVGDDDFDNLRFGYFQQKLDHYNNDDPTTFYQQYAINDRYFRKITGPVFIYIEGEGPMNKKRLTTGLIRELADESDGLLVSLEHRFYGDSVVKDDKTGLPDLSIENLKFLSSKQALYDLVTFREHIIAKYNLQAGRNKFVLVGGSYAGMLSSFARIKFPHLFDVAVASSAPVQASVDFEEYQDVVAKSFANEAVGGSDTCRRNIQNAFVYLTDRINENKDYVEQMPKMFKTCDKIVTHHDMAVFMDSFMEIFAGAVQYNKKSSTVNIESLCELANKYENQQKMLQSIVAFYVEQTGTECLDSSYQALVKELKEENKIDHSDRAWYYQTCNEFGFYQGCNVDTGCLFSDMVTVNDDMKVCYDVFKINTHMISGYISQTNLYYGGRHSQTSNIIYINGGVDPWHALSVYYTKKTRGQHVFYSPNGSHCQELSNYQKGEPADVTMTRSNLKKTVLDIIN